MRDRLTSIGIAALGLTLAAAGPSNARVIVTNLSDTVAGSGGVYGSGPPQEYAQEFTTGETRVELGAVTAVLGQATGSFTASAELVSNHDGLPGSHVLTSFTVPSIGTSFKDLTFDPRSTVTLAADTSYWFVVSATGTGSYRWDYTSTLKVNLPNYASSNNSGASWKIGSPAGPFLIRVDSAAANSAALVAAPELSTWAMLVLGFAALGFASYRRAGVATSAS
jgi:hypothetical protein